jgi:Ca-activated chloride channel homolog
MTFAEPSLLWLALLAPLAAAAAGLLWRRRLAADAAWASRALWDRLLASYRPRRLALSVAALALAVLGTSLALARPRWGSAEEKIERQGVDLVFLLDSSFSMAARDAAPSRLAVAKALVRRIAAALPGSRVALVQAEGIGVVLTPLTVDPAVLDLLLDTIEPGSLPIPGTELAPGLETAAGLFPEGGGKHRVLVLLSDGEDHGGGLATLTERLRNEGIVVCAFGVGTPEGGTLPLPDPPGQPSKPGQPARLKRDADDRVVLSRLHEEGLEDLARATGGVYLRATSAAADPAPVLRRIDRMEQRTVEGAFLNTKAERFQWPLGLAVLGLLVYLVCSPFAAGAASANTSGAANISGAARLAPAAEGSGRAGT